MFFVASAYRAGTAFVQKSRNPDYFARKYCAYPSSSYLAQALPSHVCGEISYIPKIKNLSPA
jgi:hypothetical protein